MKQGLLSIINDKIFSVKAFDGLMDIVEIILEKKEKRFVVEQFKKELDGIRLDLSSTLSRDHYLHKSLDKPYQQITASFGFKRKTE
ncbi:MAG: hypothetical protein WKF59_14930 [Chitinophagaceae bacterium]